MISMKFLLNNYVSSSFQTVLVKTTHHMITLLPLIINSGMFKCYYLLFFVSLCWSYCPVLCAVIP